VSRGARQADNEDMCEYHIPSLKENIHTILNGLKSEKDKLEGKHFFLADTPQYMKEIKDKAGGLTGDYFTARYGVITRHIGKDADHELTEQNWKDLCDEIIRPFAISRHGHGFRLFTNVRTSNNKWVVAGVAVKNVGKGLEVNSITTTFKYTKREKNTERFIYISKKITPEQTGLLDGLNSLSLQSAQERGTDDLHI
jgi:hypothetical protein